MKIIEYEDKYLEDVKDLLVELEEYIVSIDKDNLDQIHPDYREKMATLDLEKVKNNNGKCYIAVESDKVIGLIMGCIFPYDEYDYLDYKCPKRGEITELIVSKNVRSKGIGNMLMNKIEEYFKSKQEQEVKEAPVNNELNNSTPIEDRSEDSNTFDPFADSIITKPKKVF